MDLGLKGKRALVFGASAGLGKAIAQALVKEGARVAICSRSDDRIRAAAKEIGAELAFACDVAQTGASAAAVKTTTDKFGGVDILVTNTGGPPKGPFLEVTQDQWKVGFQDLWLAVTESMQAALPGMKERKWGRILLVTSAAAKEPIPGLTVSNGLRAGLLGLTKTVSHEIAQYGVTMNALLPGYTDTERLRELGVKADEKMLSQIPARRFARPEEFGALAAFLASEQAGYITGQAVACDGGYLKGI